MSEQWSRAQADGYHYSVMLRAAQERQEVQQLLDEMESDSLLSRRGGGGGLAMDRATRKLIARRWPLARLPESILPGAEGDTGGDEAAEEEEDEAVRARLRQLESAA